jgi:NAD(P)-dependent dehydrogenase (short-subunit alcohol dehydrogenase family)
MPNPSGTAVVTGASKGIGAAVALLLADSGWSVYCLSRAGVPPAKNSAASGSPLSQGRLIPVAVDITDDDAVKRFFDDLEPAPPSLLVNCAGIHVEHDSLTISKGDLDEVMKLNLFAPLHLSQLFAHQVEGSGGVILNIGSFFELVGVARSLAYSASKAALASVTRTLAVEWAKREIWVVNIAPGYVETDINREHLADPAVRSSLASRIPRGRPSTTDEVAALIVSLAVPTVAAQLTGHSIYADGGQHIRL